MKNGCAYRATRGSTLVEAMVAIVVLAAAAVAGGAFLAHSRSILYAQRARRIAGQAASGRLEELRSAGFDALRPPAEDYAPRFLMPVGGTWTHYASDPEEQILVNGRSLPLVTQVRYLDIDGGSDSYDLLWVGVRVAYRAGADDTVLQESFVAP